MQRSCRSARRGIGIISSLALVGAVFGHHPAAVAQTASSASHSTSSKTGRAQDSTLDPAALGKKLDKGLANQDTILRKLDDIMAEVKIVKVRASR